MFAKELKSQLKDKPGVAEVFICEEDVSAGDTWGEKIARKANDCDAFIPIITQEYLDSKPCYQEIHHAHYNQDKHIFPILIKDRKPEYEKGKYGGDIQLMVNQVQYTTFKTTQLELETFNTFLAAIKQKVLGELLNNCYHCYYCYILVGVRVDVPSKTPQGNQL